MRLGRRAAILEPHRLRAAGDGFFWPNLLILPEGSQTLLAWSVDDDPLAGVLRFASGGHESVDTAAVQFGLARFVTTVVDRLVDVGVSGTPLQEDWSAIAQASSEEIEFCDAAGALGLDPYDISEDVAARVESIGAALEPELVREFTAAADPQRIAEDIGWVTEALARLRGRRSPSRALIKLQRANVCDDGGETPWEVGYARARATRSALKLNDTDAMEFGDLVGHHRLMSADPGLQGMASAALGRVEVVSAVAPKSTTQRFLDGRALWRALGTRDRPYLLTQGVTFEQRVERAFSAELLAPAAGLSKLLKDPPDAVTTDEVDGLAKRFRAAPLVVQHQLENQLGLAVTP